MWVGTHAAVPGRRQFLEFRNQLAIRVKQFLRLLVAHPLLEDSQLFGVLFDVGQRHLMSAPKTLQSVTTHLLWCAPTLRRAQHNHWRARPLGNAAGAAFLLVLSNLPDAMFYGGCHGLVHALGIRPLHEVGRPAVPAQEVLQLFVGDARQKSGIIDLVAVQVQYGQDRAIANGVQELADMPGSRQRSRFGFAVPDHRGDNQVRVVERCSTGMRENVPQFAPFMDGTRSLWRAVTANPARKGELFEELTQAEFIFTLFGVKDRKSV